MQTFQTRSAGVHLAGVALVIFCISCGGGSSPAGPSAQLPSPPAASAPTVTAVSPALGATSGGLGVTITGTGFVNGAGVSIGGVAATSVAFQSATSLSAMTPAHAAGGADVVVTNPDGQGGRMASAFTYQVPISSPPSIASIGPTSGPTAGGTSVVITGAGFAAGATVSFGATAASAVSVASATSINAVAPSGSAGSVDLVVNNPDGQSGRMSGAYTYVGSAPPPPPPAPVAPTVTSVSPATGTTAGGTAVTVSGSGFAAGATVAFGSTAATHVVVGSATTITATAPANAAGAADVTVTNSNGLSARLGGAFTYTAPAPPPPAPQPTVVVVTITPAGVSPSDVTITPGTKIRFVNNDALPHMMTSDPHPDHTQCPPINQAGLLLPGQSRETDPLVTVRLCGYHDHNDSDNPRWTGTIQVR
jgi:plastocyanin